MENITSELNYLIANYGHEPIQHVNITVNGFQLVIPSGYSVEDLFIESSTPEKWLIEDENGTTINTFDSVRFFNLKELFNSAEYGEGIYNIYPQRTINNTDISVFSFVRIYNFGSELVAIQDIPEPVYTNRLYYTVVEGGTQPTSTWITDNCSDNVFEAETGEGYLVLNEGVDTLSGTVVDEQPISIFTDEASDANIKSVVIPTQIITIGLAALFGYTALVSVSIPDSVTSIGNGVFAGCTGLTSVIIPNSVTSIGNGVFHGCTGLTSVTIPNSVTSIGMNAFANCTSLTSVTIPNLVTIIDDRVFAGCTGLTSVTIPNSVTSINEEAFSGCTGLTSVIIPNSVTYIGLRAFSGCTGLTSVTIPNSVTDIDEEAFAGCTSLTSVTCFATTPPYLGSSVFASIDTTTCGVPEASIQAYKDDGSWSGAFTTFVAADV